MLRFFPSCVAFFSRQSAPARRCAVVSHGRGRGTGRRSIGQRTSRALFAIGGGGKGEAAWRKRQDPVAMAGRRLRPGRAARGGGCGGEGAFDRQKSNRMDVHGSFLLPKNAVSGVGLFFAQSLWTESAFGFGLARNATGIAFLHEPTESVSSPPPNSAEATANPSLPPSPSLPVTPSPPLPPSKIITTISRHVKRKRRMSPLWVCWRGGSARIDDERSSLEGASLTGGGVKTWRRRTH